MINYVDLVRQFGTPLYVYDADKIIFQYRSLKNAISDSRLKIFYAMKANYSPAILTLLEQEGACIDAVSPGDVHLALACGFTPGRILFTANKITDAEMEEVHALGVLTNIGSLSRLEKFGRSYPHSNVCLRFNPEVIAGENEKVQTGGESSKFGISLKKLDLALEIIQKYKLTVVGIHEHTGSGIPETVKLMEGIKVILNLVKKDIFPNLEFVDFGGGFKVSYRPEEKQVNYAEFGREVLMLFTQVCKEYGKDLGIYFEPGKFLVAEAGYLLVEVNTIKQAGTKVFAGVNSGFSQLIRPMFYGAYHHITNLSNPLGILQRYDIVGNICESGDCFAINREVATIREGDILQIQNAGAYCYSMGSVYNMRPLPSEVMVKGGVVKCVRKRLSSKEFVHQILCEWKE